MAIVTYRHYTPGVIPFLAFHMSPYFGCIGAVFCAANAYIFFGNALPMFKPRAATFTAAS